MSTASKSIPATAAVNVSAFLREGSACFGVGDLRGADAAYRKVLEIVPAHPGALQMLALVAYQSGNADLALRLLDFVIRTAPEYDAYFNRAQTLKALGRYEAALESVNHALEFKPDSTDAFFVRGILLQETEQYEAALEDYDKVLASRPGFADAWNNRGSLLRAVGRHDEALGCFERAIQLKPDFADAHYNRGNLHLDLDRYEAAIASYDVALVQDARLFGAWNNRGTAYQCMQDAANALASFEKALALKPDFKYLLGNCIYMRRHLCDWGHAEVELKELRQKLEEGKKVINPFALLSISDSPALQKRAAEICIAEMCASITPHPIPKHTRRDKIRVGYFSSDFRDHAVSYHMAEVFERHDRSRFEIYAFSSGLDTQDRMRQRVSKAMDRFLDVREMPETEVVRLSRELEIDIAVNLTGLTNGDRIRIFAERAAPIQVNYLGYPGTMGAEFMDYIIADDVLIPEESRQYYSEKIVYLPDCFQANDCTRAVEPPTTTRVDEGLPEEGFVFCCFNTCGKVTPEVFRLWMRILNRVPGSVLWMLAGSSEARNHLRAEAARQAVSPDRLIFARSVSLEEHLSRQQLADLFLDTHPFNAGATASPALWAGLPILTRIGESFAGRMGASLLQTVGLPELVTQTELEYENKAVELGQDVARLAKLKERLRQNRRTTPLFDAARFTSNLEQGYLAMQAPLQAGQLPNHIFVSSADTCRRREAIPGL